MAEPRQSGLGGLGRNRIREELGRGSPDKQIEDNLLGRNRPPAPPQPLATPWKYVDSSRVKAYQYDYGTGELRVRFVKYDTPWVYEGVNPAIFEAFDAAPSKGKFINSTLNYTSYRRASPGEESDHFNGV